MSAYAGPVDLNRFAVGNRVRHLKFSMSNIKAGTLGTVIEQGQVFRSGHKRYLVKWDGYSEMRWTREDVMESA